MRKVCGLTLCMTLFFVALPMSAHAANPESFDLPEAIVGEQYHVDVESILKSKYGLRIDSDAQTSILQWSFAGGELPQGLTVQTNGSVVGIPSVYSDHPYRFRLQVIDIGIRSRPLYLDVTLVVGLRGLRLTEIVPPPPRLVRINGISNNNLDDESSSQSSRLQANHSEEQAVDSPTSSNHFGGPTRDTQARGELPDDNPSSVSLNTALISAWEPIPARNLFKRATGDKKDLVIDLPPKSVPKPLEVLNGTVVTVKGTKSPVESCIVMAKRDELKPEPSPLAQMLKILIGLGTFGVADVVSVDSFCPSASVAVPSGPEAGQIVQQVGSIRQSLFDGVNALKSTRHEYEQRAKRVKNFTSCKGIDGRTDICTAATSFDGEKASLGADLEGLFKEEIPTLESTELQIATLKKVLSARYKMVGGGTDEAKWIVSINSTLDCFAINLEAAKKSRDFLQSVRSDLEKFREALETHKTSFDYSHLLIADSNAKVTGSVTCTNSFTKQVTVEALPFTITYQGISRFSVSAGILFSLLNKRQIQSQPVRTGTAADGSPTLRLEFSETDLADNQVVPFSFFNYYLTGTRKFNLNVSGGVGLNPNNGSNQVEYFLGGALGIKNVFLQFGGHVGRWQELGGGFRLGEPVPDKFPSSIPIERRYSVRPAFGFSYKLPLP